MKQLACIVIITMIIGLSGCVGTKIYLGGEGEKELSDSTPISRAIDPSAIPVGGTWGTIRAIINANFDEVDLAIDTLDAGLADAVDSISAHRTAIGLRLLKTDTATMLSPYALTSELSDAGTSIGDVRDEIADSLNVLRPLYVAVADTASMLDPYAKLTDLSEGGISIGAVQDEIADSLNVLRPLVVMAADSLTDYVTPSQLSDSLATVEGGGVTIEEVQGEISDSLDARIGAGVELSDIAVMIADSTGNAPGNYVTLKALNDSIAANLGGAVGITLNSGTLTLNGSGGTADDIIFYTNGDGSYDLPAGGGNLTIMSQVQGWINDSIDAQLGSAKLFFAPMIGVGQANDTTLFSTGDILYGFRWGGDYNLVLTSVTGVVYGTTPDIDIAILKDVNYRDATPSEVLSADLTITSTTTGNSTSSFSSGTIVPGDFVWIRVDQCTAQPTQCLISIYGYLTR